MKKLFTTFTVLFMLVCIHMPTKASTVIVDYQGPTVVQQRTIERRLLVNCGATGRHNIAVKPLDDALRSVDGKVEIPLQYVYLNNNKEDVYLRYNDYSELFTGLEMEGVPYQFTARVRDYGMIPAGIYNLNFEIQATDVTNGTPLATSSFNLQFIVPSIQKINVQGKTSRIAVSTKDVVNKTRKINNEASPMVYISSNSDWVLYLRVDDFDNSKAEHYVRTIAASPNIKERLQERVLLQPGKEIIIARGKAPADNEYVSVEFSVDNNEKGIKAGTYENRVRYILKEDKN